MVKVLLIYSTVDGQTLKICQSMKQVMEENGHQVTLLSIKEKGRLDLNSYDKIVIGASIRYGFHRSQVASFIKKNQKVLDSKPNFFFSVNLVARKPEKCKPESNPYLQKFLKKLAWRPTELAVFAGKLDYPSYNFFDRFMIQFIMRITKGPTDPSTVHEFTNWERVEAFGKMVCQTN